MKQKSDKENPEAGGTWQKERKRAFWAEIGGEKAKQTKLEGTFTDSVSKRDQTHIYFRQGQPGCIALAYLMP